MMENILSQMSELLGVAVTEETLFCYMQKYDNTTDFFIPLQRLIDAFHRRYPDKTLEVSAPQMIDGGYWSSTAKILSKDGNIVATATRRCKEGIFEDPQQMVGDAFNLVGSTAIRAVLKLIGFSAESLVITKAQKELLTQLWAVENGNSHEPAVKKKAKVTESEAPVKNQTESPVTEVQDTATEKTAVADNATTSSSETPTTETTSVSETPITEKETVQKPSENPFEISLKKGKFRGTTVQDVLSWMKSDEEALQKKAEALKNLILSEAGRKKFPDFAEALSQVMETETETKS
jgi:hypothetical protein